MPNHTTRALDYSASNMGWGHETQAASIDILPQDLYAERSSPFTPAFPTQHDESLELSVVIDTMGKAHL